MSLKKKNNYIEVHLRLSSSAQLRPRQRQQLYQGLLPPPGVGGTGLRENRNYKRCKRPWDEGFGQHQEMPPLLTKQQLKSHREAALQGCPFPEPPVPSEGGTHPQHQVLQSLQEPKTL